MSDLNEAREVIWSACKSKERCPKKIIEGQIKWYAKKQLQRAEVEHKAAIKQLKSIVAEEVADAAVKNFIEQGQFKEVKQ